MQTNVLAVQRALERALAFAHAALDDPSEHKVLQARYYAEAVLPRVTRLAPAQLGEASLLVERVRHLRAVLSVLERRTGAAAGSYN